MRRKFVFCLLCLIAGWLSGNAQASGFLTDNVTGSVYRAKMDASINGNPFFIDEWLPGVITLRSGQKADKYHLKLDVYSNELLFQYEGNALVVVNPVKEFVLKTNFGRSYLFRAGFLPVERNTENTFYQVLTDGPVTLLKLTRKIITERQEYNQAAVIKEFEASESYYIANADGGIEKIRKDKKSLLAAINDADGSFAKWLEKKGLRCKSEEELVKAVTAYNNNQHK
jgi:hypothetical protein